MILWPRRLQSSCHFSLYSQVPSYYWNVGHFLVHWSQSLPKWMLTHTTVYSASFGKSIPRTLEVITFLGIKSPHKGTRKLPIEGMLLLITSIRRTVMIVLSFSEILVIIGVLLNWGTPVFSLLNVVSSFLTASLDPLNLRFSKLEGIREVGPIFPDLLSWWTMAIGKEELEAAWRVGSIESNL